MTVHHALQYAPGPNTCAASNPVSGLTAALFSSGKEEAVKMGITTLIEYHDADRYLLPRVVQTLKRCGIRKVP
jgi:hypothetical protein